MVDKPSGVGVDDAVWILRPRKQPVASLKRWIAAALLGCGALAMAYLPPRGAKSSGTHDLGSVFFMRTPRGTPARLRAQALADEWRTADASLRLLKARYELAARVRLARDSGNSLIVSTESPDVAMSPSAIVDSAAHLAWHQLGLGETKISVVLIFQLARAPQAYGRPTTDEDVAGYLAPDSTDRTMCIAVVPAGRYWTRYLEGELQGQRRISLDVLVQSLKADLGPCAFYAAFGTPSRIIRGWLTSRSWDLALHLDPGPPGPKQSSLFDVANAGSSWYWDVIYSLPPNAVACLASRDSACRDAVLAGASDEPVIEVPDVMRITRRWDRALRLVGDRRFLGDVARSIGRDRFLSLWTTVQPVDTALAVALKRSVGEWTADWESNFVQPIRLGPTPPLGAVGIALTIAVFAIAMVALMASRRQVR